MATRDMPWVPANMTPERRKRLEAFSRYRRISRQEAAGILIDAGIEAMRPVVEKELAAQSDAIKSRLLGNGEVGERPPLHERRLYTNECICGAPWTSRHVDEAKA